MISGPRSGVGNLYPRSLLGARIRGSIEIVTQEVSWVYRGTRSGRSGTTGARGDTGVRRQYSWQEVTSLDCAAPAGRKMIASPNKTQVNLRIGAGDPSGILAQSINPGPTE